MGSGGKVSIFDTSVATVTSAAVGLGGIVFIGDLSVIVHVSAWPNLPHD